MDIPAPSFSLLNTSNSQGLTPSDSLSFPSEPPEIGKWFSSYCYESPWLNIGENTECSESIRENDHGNEEYDVEDTDKDKDKEGNLAELQKPRKRDRFVAEENLDSKGVGRCKNAIWPNSYENQVLGSPDSLLLTSEPPNIKNWFSSYVYESPALECSDDIEFSDYKEHIVDVVGCTTEKVSRAEKDLRGSSRIGRNDDSVDEKMASGGYNKSKRSEYKYACKGNNGVDEDHASSASTEVPSTKTSELILEGKRAKDHDHDSTKVAALLSFNVKDPTKKLCTELPGVAKCSVHNDELSPKRLISWRDSTKEGSEGKAQAKDECNISAQRESDIITVDGDSWNRISRSGNKENDGNDFAATHFVSVRKSSSRREKDENSLTNLVGDRSKRLQNGGRVSADGHKVQRKVLSETTNIRQSDALEITGKWRCPQKSKPNLGPPLKQLRLERWVHRV